MLRKAAALLLICAGTATWMGCAATTSHFVFAAIPSGNQIVAYREDPNSGVLTALANSPYTVGTSVQSLVVHPSHKYLYAANAGESDISLFTINTVGGLTEVTPRTSAGTTPFLVTMDPGGKYLYVANKGSNNISVYSINSGTGALTEISGSPFPVGIDPLSMVVSPSGQALYVGAAIQTSGLVIGFAINPAGTQFLTPVAGSPFITGNDPYGLTIDPAGKYLYTANNIDNSISEFTVGANGTLTEIAGSPLGETYKAPVALLVDTSGKYLFIANSGSANVGAFTIGSGGSLSVLTSNPGFVTSSKPAVLAIDPSGKYVYVGNQSGGLHGFALNGTTGVLTEFASYSPGNPTSIVVIP
jgi:6-phosphogluconolactonase